MLHEFHDNKKLMLSSTGPTIGFFFLVLSAFICWPIALLFCCFTEQGKKHVTLAFSPLCLSLCLATESLTSCAL